VKIYSKEPFVRKPSLVKSRKSRDRRFATAVRAKLAERNKTLRSIADQIGVPIDRVRQWLVRNIFPADGLVALAATVGLETNVEELKRTYGVQITTHGKLKSATPNVAETMRYYLPPAGQDDFGADVKRFLRSMNDGETFIVWGVDELPFEWRNDGWGAVGNAVAAAICKKKIFCIYVHPDDAALQQLREECGLRKLPRADFFEAAFAQFKQNLGLIRELRDLTTGEVLKDHLTDRQIEAHVIRVATPYAAFCSPHHRYVVFTSVANAVMKQPSALAQFPTGDINTNTNREVLLPLTKEVTLELYDFLITCLSRKGPHRLSAIVKMLAPVEKPSGPTPER
jgi:hypothetical protein